MKDATVYLTLDFICRVWIAVSIEKTGLREF